MLYKSESVVLLHRARRDSRYRYLFSLSRSVFYRDRRRYFKCREYAFIADNGRVLRIGDAFNADIESGKIDIDLVFKSDKEAIIAKESPEVADDTLEEVK